jgi:hypothetical protein
VNFKGRGFNRLMCLIEIGIWRNYTQKGGCECVCVFVCSGLERGVVCLIQRLTPMFMCLPVHCMCLRVSLCAVHTVGCVWDVGCMARGFASPWGWKR